MLTKLYAVAVSLNQSIESLLYIATGFQSCGEGSPFLCQISSEISGAVYTPNIPNFYFDDTIAAALSNINLTTTSSSRGTTFIFTIPAVSAEHNCSGPVVALQFCYRARQSHVGQERNVFDLITLYRDGPTLTVADRFSVLATPQEDTCTILPGSSLIICCATQNMLNHHQFLVSYNTTFGVVNTADRNIRILTFINSVTEFDVEQLQVRKHHIGLEPGDTVSPGNGIDYQNHPLLLLRFHISECYVCTSCIIVTHIHSLTHIHKVSLINLHKCHTCK